MLFVKPTSDHRESPSSISDELTIARRLRGDTDGEPHIGSGVLRRPADQQTSRKIFYRKNSVSDLDKPW